MSDSSAPAGRKGGGTLQAGGRRPQALGLRYTCGISPEVWPQPANHCLLPGKCRILLRDASNPARGSWGLRGPCSLRSTRPRVSNEILLRRKKGLSPALPQWSVEEGAQRTHIIATERALLFHAEVTVHSMSEEKCLSVGLPKLRCACKSPGRLLQTQLLVQEVQGGA